ncbi:AlpA family phage regulatory protein [uncultured Desulfuromusa sp.]|uniref:helix-turn-helix transcriptional regulator n=1 Tax=uncultured Desulfuromusa sp. TaxID=219183 RepID=UPI002AA75A27|nr:AlpA family phage regulatory protein [uncultured Desulfuromusa sp.]
MEDRLLQLAEVEGLISCKKTKIYQLIQVGKFPAPIMVGAGRARRWSHRQVQDWIADQIKQQAAQG